MREQLDLLLSERESRLRPGEPEPSKEVRKQTEVTLVPNHGEFDHEEFSRCLKSGALDKEIKGKEFISSIKFQNEVEIIGKEFFKKLLQFDFLTHCLK